MFLIVWVYNDYDTEYDDRAIRKEWKKSNSLSFFMKDNYRQSFRTKENALERIKVLKAQPENLNKDFFIVQIIAKVEKPLTIIQAPYEVIYI